MNRNYWPLFFIGIFSFVFAMIIWTIMSASSVPINPDKSFLKSYAQVDESYNDIMTSNIDFLEKYDFNFFINNKKIELSTQDIKYSQRVLEKISKHKKLLILGKNTIHLIINDKKNNEKQKINISLLITKSSTNDKDILLSNKNFTNNNNDYFSSFNINEENNWNITGTFEVDGQVGHIFIKTNAI